MLPIEMNDEKPRLRSDAFSSSASPSAPLCEEKAIGPGGSARGPKVAFSDGAATAMPRQFGPTRRPPCARTSASSCSWRSRPSSPISAKPAEITQSARTPGSERGLGRVQHVRARKADDGEVDGLGKLLDRGVGAHAGHGLAAAVHRVRGALELAGEDVPEDDAADRLAPCRGADHGDAGGREERAERGDDAEVVSLVDVTEVRLGRLDRERDLERPAVERARDAEARVLEDPHHRRVVGHHLGDEALDPDRGRALRELLEHARADAAPLLVVGDRERDLRGRRVAEPRIARQRDDVLTVAAGERPDERASLDPVRLEERLDERRLARWARRGSGGRGSAPRGARRSRGAHRRLRCAEAAAAASRRRAG